MCYRSIDTHLYRQQLEAAVSVAVEHYRDRAYREALRNTLVTIQTAADEFTQKADYQAALSIFEVLVAEAVKYYFAIETGYLLFTSILAHCIDGLDSCVLKPEKIRRCVSGLSNGSLQSIASQ